MALIRTLQYFMWLFTMKTAQLPFGARFPQSLCCAEGERRTFWHELLFMKSSLLPPEGTVAIRSFYCLMSKGPVCCQMICQ